MAYVLRFGRVFIKPLHLPSCNASPRTKQGVISTKFDSGFLATCRQAYEEGHQRLHSQNTSFLPPGSLQNTVCWEGELRSEHRGLVRSLGMAIVLSHSCRKDARDREGLSRPSLGTPDVAMTGTNLGSILDNDEEMSDVELDMLFNSAIASVTAAFRARLESLQVADAGA